MEEKNNNLKSVGVVSLILLITVILLIFVNYNEIKDYFNVDVSDNEPDEIVRDRGKSLPLNDSAEYTENVFPLFIQYYNQDKENVKDKVLYKDLMHKENCSGDVSVFDKDFLFQSECSNDDNGYSSRYYLRPLYQEDNYQLYDKGIDNNMEDKIIVVDTYKHNTIEKQFSYLKVFGKDNHYEWGSKVDLFDLLNLSDDAVDRATQTYLGSTLGKDVMYSLFEISYALKTNDNDVKSVLILVSFDKNGTILDRKRLSDSLAYDGDIVLNHHDNSFYFLAADDNEDDELVVHLTKDGELKTIAKITSYEYYLYMMYADNYFIGISDEKIVRYYNISGSLEKSVNISKFIDKDVEIDSYFGNSKYMVVMGDVKNTSYIYVIDLANKKLLKKTYYENAMTGSYFVDNQSVSVIINDLDNNEYYLYNVEDGVFHSYYLNFLNEYVFLLGKSVVSLDDVYLDGVKYSVMKNYYK